MSKIWKQPKNDQDGKLYIAFLEGEKRPQLVKWNVVWSTWIKHTGNQLSKEVSQIFEIGKEVK